MTAAVRLLQLGALVFVVAFLAVVVVLVVLEARAVRRRWQGEPASVEFGAGAKWR